MSVARSTPQVTRNEHMVQGFGGDMGSLLKQAQEMQRRMQEIEQELGDRTIEGSAGGGAGGGGCMLAL